MKTICISVTLSACSIRWISEDIRIGLDSLSSHCSQGHVLLEEAQNLHHKCFEALACIIKLFDHLTVGYNLQNFHCSWPRPPLVLAIAIMVY